MREDRIKLHGKQVIWRRSPRGLAIVIMPDKKQIDNFHHGYPHIHPERAKIKSNDLEVVLSIVINHIKKNKSINIEKLRRELGVNNNGD
ncbi:MAG: hypothetical protein ACE5KE_10610 [Methanosarcinales archaeon]